MRSRIVILTMLVVGMLMSTAGAGLAIVGGGSNASVAQYGKTTTPPPPTTPPPSNEVLGDQDSGQGTQPTTTNGGTPKKGVQPARQVEAGATAGSTGNLPFTGFAAVPILLGGIVLLSVGLVLRRRTGDER